MKNFRTKKARCQSGLYKMKVKIVGMTGFEPAASSSRTTRATGLRYIPNCILAGPTKVVDSQHFIKNWCRPYPAKPQKR